MPEFRTKPETIPRLNRGVAIAPLMPPPMSATANQADGGRTIQDGKMLMAIMPGSTEVTNANRLAHRSCGVSLCIGSNPHSLIQLRTVYALGCGDGSRFSRVGASAGRRGGCLLPIQSRRDRDGLGVR